ncbi:MAG: glycosyltransferase family 4 protein [Candidatus Methylomirabilales bacterium]
MQILMCTSLFHPFIGGSERQAQVLAKALIRRGHAVTVVTQRFPHLPPFEVIEGVPVYRDILTLGRGPVYGLSYLLSSALSLLRHRGRYQIIHVHHLYLDAFAAAVMGRFLRRPALAKVACGGYVGDMARLRQTLFSPLFFSLARRLDRIVAISSQIREELINHGFDPNKIVMIPNGVDTEKFHPVVDREAAKRSLGVQGKLVSFAGRLHPQKGLIFLLQAWERVVAKQADATLLLLGRGPQERQLREMADRLGISHRVTFLGEKGDVRPYFQASDVFVLSSLAEGMSNVLLEAMATGVPCVATRVGGNVDLVGDGINGLLVEPRNAHQLAEAILCLLQDPDFGTNLEVAARQTVEHGYSVEQVAGQYLKLYQELLDVAGH